MFPLWYHHQTKVIWDGTRVLSAPDNQRSLHAKLTYSLLLRHLMKKCHTYLCKSKFLFMPPAWWMQIVTCLRLLSLKMIQKFLLLAKNVANRLQHLSPNDLNLPKQDYERSSTSAWPSLKIRGQQTTPQLSLVSWCHHFFRQILRLSFFFLDAPTKEKGGGDTSTHFSLEHN